jgi:hypothetical protein
MRPIRPNLNPGTPDLAFRHHSGDTGNVSVSIPSPDRKKTGIAIGLILGLVMGACSPILAAESTIPTASPGDSTDEVIAKLGKPTGAITRGRVTLYYYDRGMVDFVDGRVRTAFLVSPEKAQHRHEEQERAEAANRKEAEAQRQRLTEEGRNELTRKQADATFGNKPGVERLAYWRDFAHRYPYTDVSNELTRAQAAAETESNQQKQAAELQALKDRFAAIRARLAQLDADYAASLAHWKRNEIDAERARLKSEETGILSQIDRLREAEGKSDPKKE